MRRRRREAAAVVALDQALEATAQREPQRALEIVAPLDLEGLAPRIEMRADYLSGWALTELGRLGEAVTRLQTALAVAQEIGEGEYKARISNRLGIAYYKQGKLVMAERCFIAAWNGWYEAEIIDIRFAMLVSHNLGNVALRQGNLPMAIGHYHEALRYALDLNDTKWIGAIYWGLGLAHLQSKELEEAYQAMTDSLMLQEANPKDSFLAEVRGMYGAVANMVGRTDEALAELRHTVYLAKASAAWQALVLAHANLAETYLKRNEPNNALGEAEEAVSLARDFGLGDLDRAQVQHTLARVYAALGRRIEADQQFSTAEHLAEGQGERVTRADMLYEYAVSLVSWGEATRAAQKLAAANRLRDARRD